jgi:hypothetical protein
MEAVPAVMVGQAVVVVTVQQPEQVQLVKVKTAEPVQHGQEEVAVVLLQPVVLVQRTALVVLVVLEQHRVLQVLVSHTPVAAVVVHIVEEAGQAEQQDRVAVVLADLMLEAPTELLISVAVVVVDQTTTVAAMVEKAS